jgi:GntR family transcriptional repressor for pyruvate dehydrogenase complex
MNSLDEPSRVENAADQLLPIERSSVSDAIVDQIISLIARSLLKSGDRLPSERELGKRFGVGRTSVREALRSLTTMGIVDGRVGEGTFVADNRQHLGRTLQWGMLLDSHDVENLIETRLMLESNTAFWAATRATEEDLATITAHLTGMEDNVFESEQFLEYDLRFHLEIASATQNPILQRLVSTTRGYLQEWIKGSLKTPSAGGVADRAQLSVEQHRVILTALAARQADVARDAMGAHILSSSKDLQAQI